MKLSTLCLLHLITGLHTTCNIKPSRKINITRRVIKRGVFLLQPSDSSPSRIYSFRAHVEMLAPPPPRPPPIPLVQTPHLKSKSARVVNTTSQLVASHYPSSHPCRSSNLSPPSPPPFVPRPVRSNAPLTIEIGQSNKH